MHNFTKGLLLSSILTLISIQSAVLGGSNLAFVSTLGIIIFWIISLIFFFLRGIVWYRSDLAKRTMKEVEQSEDRDEEDKKSGISFKVEE